MKILRFTLLVVLLAGSTLGENLVLINGSIIDGTGKPRVLGNVRIREGKITDIGAFRPMAGEMTLDVKGLIVAPGFIDLQTLSPSTITKDLSATSLVSQGVTTAVLGSDGTGPYSVEEFMLPFDEKPAALNIAMLVGHATVRRQIMGTDYKRAATAGEVERMSELVTDAMKQGAFGFASELLQEPASFSSPEELLAVAKAAAKLGGTIVVTPRDINEAIALARETKAPVEVLNADKTALAEIDKARSQRIDIGADAYSLAQLVNEKGVTLERGIQRLSSAPASRIALRERGLMKRGVPADIVVLNPQMLAAGPKYVFVNGIIVVKDGQATDAHPGQAVR